MALTGKQAEYVRGARARWNVKTGAVRSGKTWLDYAVMIPLRVMEAPVAGEIVLLGNTVETVRRNILRPMAKVWAGDLVGEVGGDGAVRLFGRRVHVLGADRADRVKALQGMSVSYAYGDEVTTWARPVFEMLMSRLDQPESVFDGTCNPAGPGHWFKRFLDGEGDIFQQAYTIDDNPYLPEAFVRELKGAYAGTVLYDRYILGKWTRAEGLVYRGFDPGKHVAEGAAQVRYVGFAADVGHSNATAFLALGEAGDGRLYVLDEYYHSGRETGETKSPLGYARDFAAFRKGVLGRYPGARAGGVYVDPSAVGFMAQLREVGVYAVYRAKNAVLPGIAAVASRIERDGLRVLAGCGHLLEELAGYVWDDRAAEEGMDRPVKEADHCVDALRYYVGSRR